MSKRARDILVTVPMFAVAAMAFSLPHVDASFPKRDRLSAYAAGGIMMAMGAGFLATALGLMRERR